jgi:hypothetical protein
LNDGLISLKDILRPSCQYLVRRAKKILPNRLLLPQGLEMKHLLLELSLLLFLLDLAQKLVIVVFLILKQFVEFIYQHPVIIDLLLQHQDGQLGKRILYSFVCSTSG